MKKADGKDSVLNPEQTPDSDGLRGYLYVFFN